MSGDNLPGPSPLPLSPDLLKWHDSARAAR